ncbi:hypothetical protein PIB30_093253, partial [Stylosanthes scabra]|nr:hypothetical protein [Stylosanthes scabra]
NAVWTEERRFNLAKTHGQGVQRALRQNTRSLCGRHAYQDKNQKRPHSKSGTSLRKTPGTPDATQPRQMCIRGGSRKISRLHVNKPRN